MFVICCFSVLNAHTLNVTTERNSTLLFKLALTLYRRCIECNLPLFDAIQRRVRLFLWFLPRSIYMVHSRTSTTHPSTTQSDVIWSHWITDSASKLFAAIMKSSSDISLLIHAYKCHWLLWQCALLMRNTHFPCEPFSPNSHYFSYFVNYPTRNGLITNYNYLRAVCYSILGSRCRHRDVVRHTIGGCKRYIVIVFHRTVINQCMRCRTRLTKGNTCHLNGYTCLMCWMLVVLLLIVQGCVARICVTHSASCHQI